MNSTEAVKNFFGLAKMPFTKSVGINELFRSCPSGNGAWRFWAAGVA